MALTPGARLGPYETLGLIGAGGMGEVYRARDTRLNRIVALKILPAPFATDNERRARFEREAQAIAALNHPHICTLHDIGEANGTTYLIMEHLAGETLDACLRRGPVPLAEALAIAAQIADGLAAAHKAGIVHRDLKPANVMLVGAGTPGQGPRGTSVTVKLLDFGLAKLRAHGEEPAMSLETHTTEALTARGTVIGTLPYMAPEQVQGLEADARTDIWALGAILYEMVAGVRTFDGSNAMSLAGAILERDPAPLSARDKSIPPALDRLVRRCLAKARENRWAHAHDVAEELRGIAQDLSEPLAAIVPQRSRRRAGWAALAMLVITGAAALYLSRASRPVTSPVVDRELARLTFEPGLQSEPSWSPDGQLVAYASDPAGNLDIWVQQVRRGRPVQVTTHSAHDRQPDWSPDGQWIAFRSERDGGGVYVVPALGGHERRVSSIGFRPQWSPDGTRLLVADADRVFPQRAFVIDASGGQPREVMSGRGKKFRWHPTWYPPGQLVSFWERAPDTLRLTIRTMSVDGSIEKSVQFDAEQQRRMEDAGLVAAKFRWSPSGDAIYLEGGSSTPTASTRWLMNVWRVRVDPGTVKAVGAPERLTSGTTIDRDVSLSRDGRRLAFVARTDSNRLWGLPFDGSSGAVLGDGRALTEGAPSNAPFDLSADGNTVVYCARPAGKDAQQLWRVTLSSGRREQLAEVRECFCPRMSRDGAWITFRSERYSLEEERQRALAGRPLTRAEQIRVAMVSSGGGEDRTVADDLLQVFGWSGDGAEVIGTCKKSRTANWIAAICSAPVDASHPARVLLADPAWHLFHPGNSPDRRWMVFQAVDMDGRSSLIGVGGVAGGAWKPLTGEGWADKPRWAPDGKTVYFVTSFERPYFDVGALRFDARAGTAIGEPIRVTRFNRSERMLAVDSETELGVSEHTLVVNMQESTGNIWVLDDVNR